MSEIKKIYDGRDLMLFDENDHSFAYSTNHQLALQIETQSIASKDNGIFDSKYVSNISWEITSENLATSEYHNLFYYAITHDPIKVKFGIKQEVAENITVADGNLPYWTLDGEQLYYVGKVIISSLQLSANNGEKASYSITLSGVGKLVQTDDLTSMSVDDEGFGYAEDEYMHSADVYLPEPLNKLSFVPHIEATEAEAPRFTNEWVEEGGTQVVDFNIIGASLPCGICMLHYDDDNVTVKKVKFELYVKQRQTPYIASNPTITIKSYNDGRGYEPKTYNLSVSASTGESEHLILDVPVPTDNQGNLLILISNNDHLCVKDIELKYIENN